MKFVFFSIIIFTFCHYTYGQSNLIIKQTIEDSQMKEILSASGIEIIDNKTYIVSDNQNVLFVKSNQKIRTIFLRDDDNNKAVAKAIKKDFESICHYKTDQHNYLLIISSGSLINTRDSVFIFDIDKEKLISAKNVRSLYNQIQKRMRLPKGQLINIEASTVTDKEILIFHRGNESKQNYLIRFKKQDFINYLINKHPVPEFTLTAFNLPIKKELEEMVSPGISGAYTIDNHKILITYSMERTSSNYNDGEILGSYIGMLNLSNNNVISTFFSSKSNNLEIRKIKVEGVAINKLEKNIYQISVVSDNDNGISDFIKLKIGFN